MYSEVLLKSFSHSSCGYNLMTVVATVHSIYIYIYLCIHICIYVKVRKSRFTFVDMEKDMQVMIITVALLTQKNVTLAHCTRYNLVSAQIASLHYLHILVVYLLHSSTLWQKVLYCHQFLDMLLLCGESCHPQYVVFMKTLYL